MFESKNMQTCWNINIQKHKLLGVTKKIVELNEALKK